MVTKLQSYKKTTRQVRIDAEVHKQLKFAAVLNNTSMTALLDKIVTAYLEELEEKNTMKLTTSNLRG